MPRPLALAATATMCVLSLLQVYSALYLCYCCTASALILLLLLLLLLLAHGMFFQQSVHG